MKKRKVCIKGETFQKLLNIGGLVCIIGNVLVFVKRGANSILGKGLQRVD